jgi:hypothetical protein
MNIGIKIDINTNTKLPSADEIANEINDAINKHRRVAFLAIDTKTHKSVHYGSADYPLRKIGGKE